MSISLYVPKYVLHRPRRLRLTTWVRSVNGLRAVAVVTALGVAIPILVILFSFAYPQPETWRHIADTLLGDLIKNTLSLCIGTLIGTFTLGVGSAWLTAMYDFPGRNFFNWALILPLALPTYVLAFVFIGMFDFAGPVQTMLRTVLPGSHNWFPDIRSTGGVILVMSLALYPYVYLLSRNAFRTQGRNVLEVSRVSGYTTGEALFKAVLPMARPWIASGLLLVLMETLADFGAVSIFNFDTFTTGIYKAWFGFFSLPAAAQLSSVLLVFVFLVIIVEQHMRAKMEFNQVGDVTAENSRIPLVGWKKWSASGLLALILIIAFVAPCIVLLVWSLASISAELQSGYIDLLSNSLIFSSLATGCIVGTGLLLSYVQRLDDRTAAKWTTRISTLGYAVPGTVLAVGVVIMISFIDRQLINTARHLFGLRLDPVFGGTLLVVVFAYVVRFLTTGFNRINSSMLRISKSVDEASRMLGVTGIKLLRKVHVPILRNGLYTAAMLVFVDVMKEMPITLMTRPFGWDTLAVKIFELTSEGEWERAALPSMALVIAGLIPLILLNKRSEQLTTQHQDRDDHESYT